MELNNFKGTALTGSLPSPLQATWISPSNIAIVKYWGKTGLQIPVNPSVSMTLSRAHTETRMTLLPGTLQKENHVEFYLDQKFNPAFGERTSKYLASLEPYFPFLRQANIRIDTRNTFPHSAGIASSASGFSALALCICSLEEQVSGKPMKDFFQIASHVARLGSGSACRSVYGGFVVWGETPAMEKASNEFALPLQDVHPVFNDLQDAILILSSEEKKVSSTAGHHRMTSHPFSSARIHQAQNNTKRLFEAFRTGDIQTFIDITENEALTLHALMMTSDPGFILMSPDSVRMIQRIQEFRQQTGTPICFTLDAGPNIHLLFFKKDFEQVNQFIVEDLLKKDKQNNWIHDNLGTGPYKSETGKGI